jgi:hypothetical protein
VETVFHEFGHTLQHMLTTVEDGLVAGIRGVSWDAVELASQFMENWWAGAGRGGVRVQGGQLKEYCMELKCRHGKVLRQVPAPLIARP